MKNKKGVTAGFYLCKEFLIVLMNPKNPFCWILGFALPIFAGG